MKILLPRRRRRREEDKNVNPTRTSFPLPPPPLVVCLKFHGSEEHQKRVNDAQWDSRYFPPPPSQISAQHGDFPRRRFELNFHEAKYHPLNHNVEWLRSCSDLNEALWRKHLRNLKPQRVEVIAIVSSPTSSCQNKISLSRPPCSVDRKGRLAESMSLS